MSLPVLSEEDSARLEQHIRDYRSGALSLDDFRRRRSGFGICGLRGTRDRVVVRVKVPAGRLTADQLARVGELASEFSCDRCHVTTRQALQLYGVTLEDAPEILRLLAEAGLTTMESAGNRVRNVVACNFAGLCRDELFDVTPYALASAAHFHGNPACAALPRKFKIAFSGCDKDCAMTATHDVGVLAVAEGPLLGFRISAGGGLGRNPSEGQALEAFTPVDLILPTIDAVVRVFNQCGDRTNRARARLRYLVQRIGFDAFRTMVLEQRNDVLSAGGFPALPPPTPAGAPWTAQWSHHEDAACDRWRSTNARFQRQPGHACVTVRAPNGDLTAWQRIGLAAIARDVSRGAIMTTPTQNIVLPWIELHNVTSVHAELMKLDLASPDAERIPDVVSCPGAGTCQVGIAASKDLARALAIIADRPDFRTDEISRLRIRVSGCANSCARHLVADIGFHGVSHVVDGQPVPHYEMTVGGGAARGRAWFGSPAGRIPARLAPAALEATLNFYRKERRADESFRPFLDRVGVEALQGVIRPHTA